MKIPRGVLHGLFGLLIAAVSHPLGASEGPDANATVGEMGSLSILPVDAHTDDLSSMRKRGFIRILVTHSLTDFFVAGGSLKGIQADMVREYEKLLNEGVKREQDKTKILFIPVTFDELLPALERGQGDIAAALLTITPERSERFDFITGAKQGVAEVLVTHREVDPPATLEGLAGRKLQVLRGSSYVEHLQELNARFSDAGLDPVRIVEADSNLLSEDLLEMVNAGIIGATVIDDFKGRLWQQVLDDIRVHEDIAIKDGNHVGWAIRKNNPELKASLEQFVGKVRRGSLLGNILFKRYFEETHWINNPLSEAERARYEEYIELFKKYARQYDFDHLALVAQSYRESKLDHSLRSHRGAIGLMQLLPSTAKDKNVGIPDISDPENNIHAGTKYLAFLRDRYFADENLSESDQLAFTWAAYNAGPAKVRKMRELAKELGRDPNRWFGHVEVAAGRIVGRETVKYVDDIYKYYIAYRLIADLEA
jgi:membrane-bound lytic murein transglycosylase MltF